jgi:acyl-CoA synthetase (AMP-forming)/AMP-acid ligase II
MTDQTIAAYLEIVQALTADGAPFELASAELGGQQVRTFRHAATDLSALFGQVEARHGDKDFIFYEGRVWTYREVFAQARRVAAALQNDYAMAPGDLLGIASRNLPEWFVAYFAIIFAGGVTVLFNSRAAGPELAAAAETVPCKLIFSDAKCAERLAAQKVPAPRILLGESEGVAGVHLESLLRPARPIAAPVRRQPADPAMILFTSGTTGRSKGAVLTHSNLCQMAHNLLFLSTSGLHLAARQYGLDPETLAKNAPPVSALLVLPMFHISGLTTLYMTAQAGGVMTLMRRWDAAEAVRLIEANRVNQLSGPSLVVSDLLDQPDTGDRLGTLNNVAVGGQATPLGLSARVARALPKSGQGVGWGMTEVSGSVTSANGPAFAARPGSCGRASPLMDVIAVGPQGEPLAANEIGELWVRGALVMQGYWNAPEANAAAFENGWLKSGDIGYFDSDGFLYLVDRKKDMVISAGENIYCAEVERVLSAHQDILELAAFGVPDARRGERLIAAVVPFEGARLTEAEVQAFARAGLADYKVPAEVVFDLGPLPRNALEKVDKARLRARYLERLAASD